LLNIYKISTLTPFLLYPNHSGSRFLISDLFVYSCCFPWSLLCPYSLPLLLFLPGPYILVSKVYLDLVFMYSRGWPNKPKYIEFFQSVIFVKCIALCLNFLSLIENVSPRSIAIDFKCYNYYTIKNFINCSITLFYYY
jgi:hypothetical protein